jgi:hypothetical protein
MGNQIMADQFAKAQLKDLWLICPHCSVCDLKICGKLGSLWWESECGYFSGLCWDPEEMESLTSKKDYRWNKIKHLS